MLENKVKEVIFVKKKLALFAGIVLTAAEAAFFCWVVREALISTAFHPQGIVLILSIACVLSGGGSLLIAVSKPKCGYGILQGFLTAMLCYWTVILLGNTVWNPGAYAEGGSVALIPLSEISIWLSEGMYLPLLSHLALLFPYMLCLPIIFPRLTSRKRWLLCTLCALCLVGKFFVLRQFVSIDHILLWTAGAAVHHVLQQFTNRSGAEQKGMTA